MLYCLFVRLKEVTLQGYKSFASKHRFLFPSGITAIVGPNGSGKSNIADGIRWVLGEQRATQLRARKSEELIFHGTERRSRAGLAEVTLVLDNEDRWLDVDFAEVAVTRRAHRDGSSEYLLNGARVRLRDLLEILGSQLGQSNYTVIGQGLVDSALALRPEDRRTLIDEAAGVLPLQRKRDRAVRQLSETQENLTRVRDITAELGPRLEAHGAPGRAGPATPARGGRAAEPPPHMVRLPMAPGPRAVGAGANDPGRGGRGGRGGPR